jgi:hypothetical protein
MASSGARGGRYAWQLVAVLAFAATAAVAVVVARPRVPAVAAGGTACTAAGLHAKVGLAAPAGTAIPRTVYYRLALTNVSDRTCVLDGYPGVEALTGARPVGSPAALDTSVRPVAVTLTPGATAYTLLRYTTTQSFRPAMCRQVTASDLRISPPHGASGMLVQWQNPACSRPGPSFLSVQAIQPRMGEYGSPRP